MKRNNNLSGQYLIQLTIGLYFSITGLLGVMGYNSGVNQIFNGVNKLLGNNHYIPLIISITMMVCGLFLIGVLFFSVKNRTIYILILILWIVYTIYQYFTGNFMKPELLVWIQNLSKDLIILAGLWGCSLRR